MIKDFKRQISCQNLYLKKFNRIPISWNKKDQPNFFFEQYIDFNDQKIEFLSVSADMVFFPKTESFHMRVFWYGSSLTKEDSRDETVQVYGRAKLSSGFNGLSSAARWLRSLVRWGSVSRPSTARGRNMAE